MNLKEVIKKGESGILELKGLERKTIGNSGERESHQIYPKNLGND